MKILKETGKILLTLLLFYLIFRKIPVQDVKENIRLANKLYFILSLILFYVYYFFFSIRWYYLLNSSGIKVNKTRSYVYIIISFFFNNFLPNVVGQDFIRSLYASRKEFSKALGVSFIDRYLGFIGMLFLGLFAVFSNSPKIKIISIIYVILISLLLTFFYILTMKKVGRGIKERIMNLKFLKIGEEIRKFYLVLVNIRNRRTIILNGFLFSVLIQLIITLINFSIFKGFGIDISFFNLIVILPIITVLSLLPVTLNGLGVREFSYIYFFNLINIEGKDALSTSLMFFIVSVLASLLGGVLFLFFKEKSPNRSSPLSY